MKYYIGIDLGGTNVRTLLVDENGESYSEVKGPTECENGLKIGNTEMCYNVDDFECKINEVTYASHYNKQKTVYTVDLKHIVKTKTFETKFEFNIKILERSENK